MSDFCFGPRSNASEALVVPSRPPPSATVEASSRRRRPPEGDAGPLEREQGSRTPSPAAISAGSLGAGPYRGGMPAGPDTHYPDVPGSPRFPQIEEQILGLWAGADTFERSVEGRPRDDEFVFYDGPPFANGLPHYGHLLTGYVKDVVPRYRTMQGQRV